MIDEAKHEATYLADPLSTVCCSVQYAATMLNLSKRQMLHLISIGSIRTFPILGLKAHVLRIPDVEKLKNRPVPGRPRAAQPDASPASSLAYSNQIANSVAPAPDRSIIIPPDTDPYGFIW